MSRRCKIFYVFSYSCFFFLFLIDFSFSFIIHERIHDLSRYRIYHQLSTLLFNCILYHDLLLLLCYFVCLHKTFNSFELWISFFPNLKRLKQKQEIVLFVLLIEMLEVKFWNCKITLIKVLGNLQTLETLSETVNESDSHCN